MSKVKLEKNAVFLVTADPTKVVGGGVPVIIVHNEEEMESVAGRLSRIMDAVAHDLGTGVYLVVQH